LLPSSENEHLKHEARSTQCLTSYCDLGGSSGFKEHYEKSNWNITASSVTLNVYSATALIAPVSTPIIQIRKSVYYKQNHFIERRKEAGKKGGRSEKYVDVYLCTYGEKDVCITWI
jgi:hypothetical protein